MNTDNQAVVPTLECTIERIKREVLEDIKAGVVPESVGSFGELHDYVDANCYGGFCEDALADALCTHFGGRDEHEGMPDGMMDYLNNAQDAVGGWLARGGHRSRGPVVSEQG